MQSHIFQYILRFMFIPVPNSDCLMNFTNTRSLAHLERNPRSHEPCRGTDRAGAHNGSVAAPDGTTRMSKDHGESGTMAATTIATAEAQQRTVRTAPAQLQQMQIQILRRMRQIQTATSPWIRTQEIQLGKAAAKWYY